LFTENSPRKAGPLVPMTPDSGVVEEHIYEQRIATVDVQSGTLRQVSPADMYVYEYDWSPDGNQFAAIAAHGSGDNNWWIAQLYTLPSSGGAMRSIHKPALQIAVPRWSPDGTTIAFISGLMSDQSVTGGDIWAVPAGGGEARNLTPKMPASPSWLSWDGQRILFAENVKGSAGISTVDLTGKVNDLWRQPEAISAATDVYGMSLSLAADGKRSALIRQSFLHPPEVWAGETGKWTQITTVNAGVKPLWGNGKSAFWTTDGLEVQGWLLFPRDYDTAKHYPLVVQVHGGPAGACTAAWPGLSTGSLAAAGYFVLCPNPRGSFGQGESFT
jgi:dipeptidyl aminopeptidase/acylaminoacyl peptidase